MERNVFVEPATKSGASPSIRVLIVDDDPVIREVVPLILSMEEVLQVVGVAENGQDALIMTRERGPDLVVMDVRMPVMDGLEATRRIKAEFPDIIVIGFSAFETSSVRDSMLAAGALDLIAKADSADKLVPMIKQAYAERLSQR